MAIPLCCQILYLFELDQKNYFLLRAQFFHIEAYRNYTEIYLKDENDQ
jgi:hypothetical protein